MKENRGGTRHLLGDFSLIWATCPVADVADPSQEGVVVGKAGEGGEKGPGKGRQNELQAKVIYKHSKTMQMLQTSRERLEILLVDKVQAHVCDARTRG